VYLTRIVNKRNIIQYTRDIERIQCNINDMSVCLFTIARRSEVSLTATDVGTEP